MKSDDTLNEGMANIFVQKKLIGNEMSLLYWFYEASSQNSHAKSQQLAKYSPVCKMK